LKPTFEVADILRLYGDDFLHIPGYKAKVLRSITNCRTEVLGGHVYQCTDCLHQVILYNSCRSRSCPKCQIQQREKWIQARLDELLPVKYFHVVFTLPHELNNLCLTYPKQLYHLLFEAAWKTIQTFAKNELGVQTGMTAMLHTWGQNLSLHPHIHCLVPSGGIKNGNWKEAKGKGKYLYHVKAMSEVYKGIFLKELKILYKKGVIKQKSLGRLMHELYDKDWVVYAKRPFKGPKTVIKYLARYTHKVAISNHRIRSIDNNTISFDYKNYKTNQNGITHLPAQEFIRRYAQHILPKGLVRIRHFGINSPRWKKSRLELKEKMCLKKTFKIKPAILELGKSTHIICPKCKGNMDKHEIIIPIRAGPKKVC
jgi:Putative transposase/Transposase zinc-binding domain